MANERRIFIRLVVESVSPRRTIPAEELGISREDLPEEIRQTLSMEVLSRAELARGRRLRKQAEDLLEEFAERTDIGWATGRSALKAFLPRLKEIRDAYRAWRDELIGELDNQRETLIRDLESRYAGEPWLPHLRGAVERHTPGPQTLKRHVRFEIRAFEAKGVALKDLDAIDDLGDQVADRLLDEVAETASGVLDAVYEASNGVAPRTLARVQQVTKKVDRLAFIDHRLQLLRDGLLQLGHRVIDPAVAAGRRVPRNRFGEGIAALALLADGDEVRRRLHAGEALVWDSAPAPADPGDSPSRSGDAADADSDADSADPCVADSAETTADEAAEPADEEEETLALPGIGLR